jgi:hypothetical protein
LSQRLLHTPDGAIVEAPFALFDEEVKVLTRDAVVPPQAALRLVPEVLDPIDVIALIGKQFRVVDPEVVELRYIEHIIAFEAVRVDNAIGPDLLTNDRNKRVRTGIWHDHHMDLA